MTGALLAGSQPPPICRELSQPTLLPPTALHAVFSLLADLHRACPLPKAILCRLMPCEKGQGRKSKFAPDSSRAGKLGLHISIGFIIPELYIFSEVAIYHNN